MMKRVWGRKSPGPNPGSARRRCAAASPRSPTGSTTPGC